MLEIISENDFLKYEGVWYTSSDHLNKVTKIIADMDETIIPYTEESLKLRWNLAVEHLDYKINEEFDKQKIIRGLVLDTLNGNVLKLNDNQIVYRAKKGWEQVNKKILDQEYPERIDLNAKIKENKRYFVVDTELAKVDAFLFSYLVQNTKDEPRVIFSKIRSAIEKSYETREFHKEILNNKNKYLITKIDSLGYKTLLRETIAHINNKGMKFYIATDSPKKFTLEILDYILGDFKKYIDLVVTNARKPSFFSSKENFKNKDGIIYEGGSLNALIKELNAAPNRIAMAGDHPYKDGICFKRGIHPIAIVPDLFDYFLVKNDIKNENKKLKYFENKIAGQREVGKYDELIDVFKEKSKVLKEKIDYAENPYWGRLLWCGNQHSFFSNTIKNSALYTPTFISLRKFDLNQKLVVKEEFPHEL